jgi:hypothetical protein
MCYSDCSNNRTRTSDGLPYTDPHRESAQVRCAHQGKRSPREVRRESDEPCENGLHEVNEFNVLVGQGN